MSNIALRGEVVTPDRVFSPGAEPETVAVWQDLNPCPACGATPHESPLGVNKYDEPHWDFPHCFKCGYRPGRNVAVSQAEMQRQYEAFRKFVDEQTAVDAAHPSLNAPQADEVAELKAAMAAMQADLARYRAGADGGVPDPDKQPPVGGSV